MSYENVERDTATGRGLEARVLIRSALRLNNAINSTDPEQLYEAVSLNNKLWLLFYSEIESGRVQLPAEVSRNILALSRYVVGCSVRAFARDKEVLDSLVIINRRIAIGLSADNPVDSGKNEVAAAVGGGVALEA